MRGYNLFILVLLGFVAFGCARYDYYPRGIHQGEKSRPVGKNTSIYIVKKDDSLYSVGKRYGVDYHKLAKMNGIKKPYTIFVGQRIYVKGSAPSASSRPSLKTPSGTTKRPAAVRKHPSASHSAVKLIWPAKGALSSKFGPRKNRMHDGLDISAKEGTPVVAAASGLVVYADSKLTGYGNLIIVRHSSDMFTAYAHNQKNLVKRGAKVKQGQRIAYVGSTGRSSGSHLHFEVRRGETAVDPLAYLPSR